MLFNSFVFCVFLVVVLTLVKVTRHRAQNWILLAASCFFYGWWDWRFLGLLFFTSGIDFIAAQKIEAAATPRHRKLYLALSVVTNLAVLGVFKYSNFFIESISALLGGHWEGLKIVLPVGISFYTFQAMSYTIDVYRGQMPACRSVRDFFLYITFFPQLVAGPIERGAMLLPQLTSPRRVTRVDVAEGAYLILWGLCKKVLVADNLAMKVDRIFAQTDFTTADVVLGSIGFAFQIYADFSGYTDMARGVARWLGVRLCVNFDHPYFSVNPQEFWRRWHISLSTWLREYLYIPLGGNRLGRIRTYVNLVATMVLGGLWHGAAWNFVIWGAYQGALLAAHRFYVGNLKPNWRWGVAGRALAMASMFVFVMFGWLLFRAHGMTQLSATTMALAHWDLTADFLPRLLKFAPYIGLIVAVDAVTYLTKRPLFFATLPAPLTGLFYVFLIYLILLLGVTGGEQFIYFAF